MAVQFENHNTRVVNIQQQREYFTHFYIIVTMFTGLLRVNSIYCSSRRFYQALYVSSKKSQKNLRILTPILDFEQRLANPNELEENLKRRQISFNVDDLLAQWDIYSSLKAKIQEITDLQAETKRLLQQSRSDQTLKQREDNKRLYTMQLETLREDVKGCINSLEDVEDQFINCFLSLPNEIRDSTPAQRQIVADFGTKVNDERQHHLHYENAIQLYDNSAHFLHGDAAKFHNKFAFHCLHFFRRHNFIDFANPDFAKTILLEAAGMTLDKFYEVPHEHDYHHTNLIHLVGNSSMLSFLGYILMLQVYANYLPIQWIAVGRAYRCIEQTEYSLYNSAQSSTVQIFQAGTEEQMIEKFDHTLDLISHMFQKLDIHFRIVKIPANELHPAASLTTIVEMYSPCTKEYIEVGNLNYYGDYISKRLLFSYIKDRKTNVVDFPHIVSGTVCNITRLLAIILETHNGVIPSHLFEEFS